MALQVRWEEGSSAMRRPYFGPPPWNLISPDLHHKTSFQRWNLVIILILGFVVLGIYVATIGSELMNQSERAFDVQYNLSEEVSWPSLN
jgi:hypothetical protein